MIRSLYPLSVPTGKVLEALSQMTTISSIAVIGAGLSSLSLALALLRPSHTIVPASAIKIYEARSFSSYSHSPQNASGVLLTPNGLAVLDELGVLERITHKCWTSEYRVFKNRDGVTTRKVRVADEDTCGYKEHRIWRRVLPDGLVEMVVGMGVVIEYGSKFEGVLEESVIFQINGERLGAGLSVGAGWDLLERKELSGS